MCGIAGFYNLNGAPADPRILLRMMDIQRHRGPDDQGMRMFSLSAGSSFGHRRHSMPGIDPSLNGGLGFNRLSILDPSPQGHQPMANTDESVFLAFNGEIYNAFDYKAALEADGFRFRSTTDTEVILYLYERYGFEGMLERLNGMFAIVLVDLNKRAIKIARDHLGIKPLYWWQNAETFLFASEVKAFLRHPAFRAELDTANLDEYLSYRFCAGENVLLKGVRQLRPGHWLSRTMDGLTVRRFWDIPDEVVKARLTKDEALDELDHLLRRSVERQLLADVKVGCQLSGGIDSSLVSVFARTHFDADMETFSVVFDDPSYSEEHWITQAAKAAKAVSHRFTFTRDFFLSNLDSATWHLDQPVNHPNSLGIYFLAESARSNVTVLLSGEGADELMGGYMRYFYALVRPKIIPWLPLLRYIPKLSTHLASTGDGRADGVENFLHASVFQRPTELSTVRPEADMTSVLEARRRLFDEGKSDHLSNCLKFDMQTYMVDLLVRQDKMTMAHSMENRVPFLDRELVSFVRKLPPEYLVSPRLRIGGNRMRNTKILLKLLAERTFPNDFVYRPKAGFSLPLAHYFAGKKFEEVMEDRILPGMANRGLLRSDAVRTWWRQPAAQAKDKSEALWISIAFELWAQRFLDWPAAS
jgi:asparagine synthase (glutamine-hydrolysing)